MSIIDYRFRHDNSNDVLVLQVKSADEGCWPDHMRTVTWRDAKVEDFLEVAKLLETSDKSG